MSMYANYSILPVYCCNRFQFTKLSEMVDTVTSNLSVQTVQCAAVALHDTHLFLLYRIDNVEPELQATLCKY